MKYTYEFDVAAPRESLAVAYARYSSTNQNEMSIETQLANIFRYAAQKKLQICATYTDEARTGTNDRRPGFQKMIEDAKANPPWSHILVYDLSRFARNTIDAGLYTADLEDRDIDIISVTQEFSPTPEGHLLTHFMHGINQYFSENLAKFSFAGMKTTALKGHHCGGVPPLGYDVGEDKKLHINEWEADAVRLIFNMYEQHFSYSQMADRLNVLGYHTKTGQPFKKNSFDSILKQEKYCGIYIWNKSSAKNSKGHRNTHHDKPEQDQVRIQDEIPVIISKEQFDRVQALAATRTRGNCATNYRHFYLFSGMDVITCGACGSKMVGKTDTRSGKRYYYCPKHKQKSCHVVDIRADHIENFVINHLISDISSRSDLVDIFNGVNNDAEIKKLKYHLRGVKTAMTNTMKAIETGFTPELNTKLRTLSADKELVEARIAELTSQQEYMTEDDRKAVCRKLAKFLKDATSYEAKQYIRSVLKSVVVSDAGVEVTLNIA